jgi:hypothetical protein
MYETNSAGENARTDRDAPHDKKPDAAVLGRGETRVPDDDAVILTDGGTVQSGPEPRPETETSKLRRPFRITASGPATAVRETNTGLVERDDVTVEIERETRDPADLVFFAKQYNRQNWKSDAVIHLLDGESFPSYRVDDYEEWTVTFDGPVQSWFALTQQMLDGEFDAPEESGHPSHVADTYMTLSRDGKRTDAAYWVTRLTEPLVKSHADLYGHGVGLAYAAGTHAIDGASALDSAVRSQVDLLADDMEGDR